MKFGLRRPSLWGRLAARLSWKRYLRHSLGLKAPRGWGWITNPRKALYNRMYRRTTVSVDDLWAAAERASSPNGNSRQSTFPLWPLLGWLAFAAVLGGLWSWF